MSEPPSTLPLRADTVRGLIKKHFHDRGLPTPPGLLIDFVRALGEAELRGFEECLSYFAPPTPENGDR